MNNALRRTMKKVLVVLATCALLLSINMGTVFADAGYTTDKFHTKVTVNEDHTIDVTETIQVNFDTAKHGIYRNIPYDSEKYKITNINVDGDFFDVTTETSDVITYTATPGSDGYNVKQDGTETVTQKVIQIGDPDETITGAHTYTISYTLVCYVDSDIEKDYFALDVLPTAWETPIKSASVTITMPKDIDWDGMKVYSGTYGTNNAAGNIQYSHNEKNRTLLITAQELQTGVGITAECELPEGYWVGAADNKWMLIPMAIAIAVIPLLAVLMWLKWGRDPKIVKTVEFYPPEGMTPAEIGYIIDGTIDNKDMISLIMYFADKGYLTINEYDKDKFQLIKVKDIDGNEKRFAATFFNGLFAAGSPVNMDEIPSTFSETNTVAKDQLQGHYTGKNRLFTRSSSICRLIACFMMILPPVISVVFSAYAGLKFGYVFAAIPVFSLLLVGLFLVMYTFDKRESMAKHKKTMAYLIGGILIIAAVAIAALVTGLVSGNWILVIEMIASMIITYLFALLMHARTKQSAQWQGQILGFKEFIKSAELEKLKALVEENPSYFYNVMPYAYVMGLSDKWAKKFEKLPTQAPNWYTGGDMNMDTVFTVMWFNRVTRVCTHSMSKAMMPEMGGMDTGGGGIGGGFGGGGFSGGGFGGGGGGSW